MILGAGVVWRQFRKEPPPFDESEDSLTGKVQPRCPVPRPWETAVTLPGLCCIVEQSNPRATLPLRLAIMTV
jgi:hypothetical protein